MEIPSELLYTKDHEWAKVEGDECTVGITDYAQDALGDVVFVQPPESGRSVTSGEMICEVESTKSVSEIYAPVTGEITKVNADLANKPELLNQSSYESGWICVIKMSDAKQTNDLLSASDYRELTEG